MRVFGAGRMNSDQRQDFHQVETSTPVKMDCVSRADEEGNQHQTTGPGSVVGVRLRWEGCRQTRVQLESHCLEEHPIQSVDEEKPTHAHTHAYKVDGNGAWF